MNPLRRRRLERALWLTLGHWYAFYLAVGYECLQQGGTAWLAALPWASYGTEIFAALAGEPLNPGAVLLVFLTVSMVGTLVTLGHALRAVMAEEHAESAVTTPRAVAQSATVAPPVATSEPAASDDSSQRMQLLVERFRERVARL